MWRFTLALLLLVVMGSIFVGQLFDALATRQSEQRLSTEQQQLMSQVNLIQSALASGVAVDTLPKWLALSSTTSTVRYEIQSLKDYPLPVALLDQLKSAGAVFLESNDGLTAYAFIDPKTVLLITQKISNESDTLPLLLTIGFYGALLCLLLIFLTPFLLRIYRLRSAAMAFGEGKLTTRLTVGSLWYLKDIEQTFNLMAERIENLMQDMRLLSGGLSHELRTPLARIRMGLDTLCDTEDESLRTKYELRINQNLDDMEALINALLKFARLQHSLNDTEKSLVNVQAVLRQLCTKANDPRLSLFIEGDEHSIVGHENYLSLLFSNLVTNALKHCNEKVRVTLSQANSAVLVSIEDDGTGIATSDSEKIFKPFVRLAQQTTASKEGFGIGLALVERITHWLQGEVNVEPSEQLGGARFMVTLPLSKPPR